MSEIVSVGATIFSAVLWVMVGWLGKQDVEAFDGKKLFSTFLSAIIIAVLLVGWDIPTEMGEQAFEFLLLRPGLVTFLDKLLMALYRRSGLRKWLEDFLNKSD